jgi:hypothetical protein
MHQGVEGRCLCRMARCIDASAALHPGRDDHDSCMVLSNFRSRNLHPRNIYLYQPGDIMPVNISKGALKRMEERNITTEDIDDTMALHRIEDLEAEERTGTTLDTERGLRAAYGQRRRS